MKYMGSKRRIAKHILPIILKSRKPEQWYVEPFVGGGNAIEKVDGRRLAADSSRSVISALQFIRDGDIPKNNQEFTEDDYNVATALAKQGLLGRNSGLHCYALIAFSFGAKWLGGWSRGTNSKGVQRDYVAEQYRANIKQKPLLQGVVFECSGYDALTIPNDSIIYCDPPYENTTKYPDDFDHYKFWEWCRSMTKQGHKVFVSEYTAPADFICVWEKELGCSVSRVGSNKKAIERLFVYNREHVCTIKDSQ